MGLDFLRARATSYRKALDWRRVALATPSLFNQDLDCSPRVYAARLGAGKTVVDGEILGARLCHGGVELRRGLEYLGRVNDPPDELVNALEESFREGTAKVQHFHTISRTAEVCVC